MHRDLKYLPKLSRSSLVRFDIGNMFTRYTNVWLSDVSQVWRTMAPIDSRGCLLPGSIWNKGQKHKQKKRALAHKNYKAVEKSTRLHYLPTRSVEREDGMAPERAEVASGPKPSFGKRESHERNKLSADLGSNLGTHSRVHYSQALSNTGGNSRHEQRATSATALRPSRPPAR